MFPNLLADRVETLLPGLLILIEVIGGILEELGPLLNTLTEFGVTLGLGWCC